MAGWAGECYGSLRLIPERAISLPKLSPLLLQVIWIA